MLEYTMDTVSKYHLSPYVQIQRVPEGIALYQTLFGERYALRMPPEQAGALLDALTEGCHQEQVLAILNACFDAQADAVLKQLMLGGFVE